MKWDAHAFLCNISRHYMVRSNKDIVWKKGEERRRGGGEEDRFQEKRESASDDRSSSKHETQTRSEGNARVALRRSSQPLSLVSGVFL